MSQKKNVCNLCKAGFPLVGDNHIPTQSLGMIPVSRCLNLPTVVKRYVFDTFRSLGSWEKNQIIQEEPNCFNGRVQIHKWKVVFERIEEPKEVLAERVRKLWRECDNMHHVSPLKAAAAELGIELDWDERGEDAQR